MGIKRVLSSGKLSFATYKEMMQSAERALDDAYAHDIVGEVYFEGEDDCIYGLFVDAIVLRVERTDALQNANEDALIDLERAEMGLD